MKKYQINYESSFGLNHVMLICIDKNHAIKRFREIFKTNPINSIEQVEFKFN